MIQTVNIHGIPNELRRLKRWCLWKYIQRGDSKPTKVPFMANAKPCSTTNPDTWHEFGQVIECTGYDGIGFVFCRHDGYVGIDLDNSIGDDGKLKPWAQKLVDRFDTYTEISPSGKGVKMWVKGKYPGVGTGKRIKYRDGQVEMYHNGRYFAVTGWRYPGTPESINEGERQQTGIDGLYTHILNPSPKKSAARHPEGDNVDRCVKYIERCPDAISGESGHDKTLRAACECFRFGLSESDVWRVMEWFNSTKCQPQWTQKELAHKIDDARKKVQESGEFAMRIRQIEKPRVPIAKPPENPDALLKRMSETIDGTRKNIHWPWPVLSRAARALLPGTITVICGAGGSSKSLFVSQACLHWLVNEIPFAVFHLEEDREFHQMRALAQLSNNSNITDDEWVRDNPDELLNAYERWEQTLATLGKCVWDAPASDISLDDLEAWLKDRVEFGARVVVIDPITAADSGREPWAADRRFVLNAKRILRNSGASLVVVTHPRDGNTKHGNHLDNHAGGRAYNRFTQCVLVLKSCEPRETEIMEYTVMGAVREKVKINRELAILKTRNGRGNGCSIGMWFDAGTLKFEEQGLIV